MLVASSEKCTTVLHPKTLQVLYVSQSDEGQQSFAAAAEGGFLSVRHRRQDVHLFNWSSQTARFRVTFQHQFSAACVSGDLVLLGSQGGQILVFHRGQLLRQFQGHARAVTVLRYEPGRARIQSCSEDGTVRIHTLQGVCLAQASAHGLPVVDFVLQENVLISVGLDKTVKILQLIDKQDKLDFKTLASHQLPEEPIALRQLDFDSFAVATSHSVLQFSSEMRQQGEDFFKELFTYSKEKIVAIEAAPYCADLFIALETKVVSLRAGGGVLEAPFPGITCMELRQQKFNGQAVQFEDTLNRIEGVDSLVLLQRPSLGLVRQFTPGVSKAFIAKLRLHPEEEEMGSFQDLCRQLKEAAERERSMF